MNGIYEGESISKQPDLLPVEIHLSSLSMQLPSSVMQRCSSAISLELKKSGSFPVTHSSAAVRTSSSDRKLHPLISFFKLEHRKNSLGARSGEQAGCGIN